MEPKDLKHERTRQLVFVKLKEIGLSVKKNYYETNITSNRRKYRIISINNSKFSVIEELFKIHEQCGL